MLHPGEEGLEGLAVCRLGRQRQRAGASPVEGALRGDDPGPAGATCKFDRRLHRFGAGIGEEDARPVGGTSDLQKCLGQADLGSRREEVGDVHDLADLLRDGADDLGVVVSEGVDSDAGEQVEIALAIGIPDVAAFAALDHERRGAEDAKQGIAIAAEEFCVGGHG